MMRRAIVALVVALVLAGCVGGVNPSSSAGGDGASGGDGFGGDDTAGGDTWDRWDFEAGENYRFDVRQPAQYSSQVDRSATITLEVLAVEGEDVTLDVGYDDGNVSFHRTVSGRNQSALFAIQQSSYGTAAGSAETRAIQYLTMGPFGGSGAFFTNRDLSVGSTWRLAGSARSGYATANVEAESQVAGIDCYVTTLRSPGEDGPGGESPLQMESCVSPAHGPALSTTLYSSSNPETMVLDVTLVEYRAG